MAGPSKSEGATAPARRALLRGFRRRRVMPHRLTRTVTQMDNMLFSNMTLNPQPLHIDAHFCATETEWGQPLMNSLFTLGLMIGISVNDTHGRHHHRQSRHDGREVPGAAVRGRHGQLHDGDRRQARIAVAARCRHRRVPSPGLQAGRHARGRVPAPGLHAPAPRPRRRHVTPMRSLLFVPGDSPRKLEKGLSSGADALLIDLEDSVALAGQGGGPTQSRCAFLAASRPWPQRPRLFVRVNATDHGAHGRRSRRGHAGGSGWDRAAEGGRRHGCVASRRQDRRARGRVRPARRRNAHPRHRDRDGAGRLRPGHLRRCEPPPDGPDLGGGGPLGGSRRGDQPPGRRPLHRSLSARPLPHAHGRRRGRGRRHRCRLHRTSGTSRAWRSSAGRRAATASSPRWRSTRRRLPVINEAFTPSPEALARARSVVDAFAANPGVGVVGVDGEMLDRPHLRRAERVLARLGQP